MPRTKKGTCAHCTLENFIHARGLCGRCYEHLCSYDREMFDLYRPVQVRASDRSEDYAFLSKTEGLTVKQAAERMGIHEVTLRQALKRAGATP